MLQELIQPRCSGWHSHEASLWTSQCGSASMAGWCTGAHCPGWFVQTGLCAKQCPRAGAVSVPGCLVQPRARYCSDGDHQLWGTDQQVYLPAQPYWVVVIRGDHQRCCSYHWFGSSYNFSSWFLWARPNCLWHLTETCLRRIVQCPVDSALPSDVFGCENQSCCSSWTVTWLMSYPSAAAGKSLLINSFSKDNHLPL